MAALLSRSGGKEKPGPRGTGCVMEDNISQIGRRINTPEESPAGRLGVPTRRIRELVALQVLTTKPAPPVVAHTI